MRGCVHRRFAMMPPARARGIAENQNTASGILYCEKGRLPVRRGSMAF
jgi:hypothetical protein